VPLLILFAATVGVGLLRVRFMLKLLLLTVPLLLEGVVDAAGVAPVVGVGVCRGNIHVPINPNASRSILISCRRPAMSGNLKFANAVFVSLEAMSAAVNWYICTHTHTHTQKQRDPTETAVTQVHLFALKK
jgi:hypothetical protein